MTYLINCISIALQAVIGLTILTAVVLVGMVVYDTVRRWGR